MTQRDAIYKYSLRIKELAAPYKHDDLSPKEREKIAMLCYLVMKEVDKDKELHYESKPQEHCETYGESVKRIHRQLQTRLAL